MCINFNNIPLFIYHACSPSLCLSELSCVVTCFDLPLCDVADVLITLLLSMSLPLPSLFDSSTKSLCMLLLKKSNEYPLAKPCKVFYNIASTLA